MLTENRGSAAGEELALRRFLLVDPFEPLRRCLSHLVQRRPHWRVAGEAGCAVDGVRLARERRPHLAIVELCLREIDGVELTQTLLALDPELRVLGYSLRDDAPTVSRFLEAGGHGFVSKEESPAALIEAIEQVLAGRIRVAYRDAAANGERHHETEPSA